MLYIYFIYIHRITQPIGIPGDPSIAPPLPPRRAAPSYSSLNSSYLGGYGYGSSWNNMGNMALSRYGRVGMGYGAYPSYSMYGSNPWGGPSGDVENR